MKQVHPEQEQPVSFETTDFHRFDNSAECSNVISFCRALDEAGIDADAIEFLRYDTVIFPSVEVYLKGLIGLKNFSNFLAHQLGFLQKHPEYQLYSGFLYERLLLLDDIVLIEAVLNCEYIGRVPADIKTFFLRGGWENCSLESSSDYCSDSSAAEMPAENVGTGTRSLVRMPGCFDLFGSAEAAGQGRLLQRRYAFIGSLLEAGQSVEEPNAVECPHFFNTR